MSKNTILEMLDTLPQEKQNEVIDFIKFLNYQQAKERILNSDRESRIAFSNVDDLMDAIDHVIIN